MSASVNKVILIGRLGSDLTLDEIRSGNSTIKMAKGSMACTESYQDSRKEWKEVVDWINIRFYDKLAEKAIERLKKGNNIYVEGKLKSWKYEKEGKTHYATAIKIERFLSLEGKIAPSPATVSTVDNYVPVSIDPDLEDIPF